MMWNSTSSMTCNDRFLGPSLAEMCNSYTFFVFMSLLHDLIRKQDKISGICERIEPVERVDDEYDFIVIGGGAAGSVVAGRLSEIPEWKVLLLEGGPDEPAGAEIPSFYTTLLATRVDWNYTTTNESYVCLSTNGSCGWTAGKMLGGSTSHNAMKYLRGNPTDYNNWAALGNEGWSWEKVKKYFLLAEDNGEIDKVGRIHHATGGPLSVQSFPYLPPFAKSILEAADQAGYGLTEDLNGDKITGFSVSQTTSKNGVRQSSASAYLRPVRNRKNLHVSLESIGTRIIIDGKKAVGVEFYKNGELKTVRATKEVVLSAGVVRSPQLLLLSGIGPKEHLKSMGINVVKDLPGVGENLHDHVGATITFTVNDTDTFDNNRASLSEYLVSQTGPLSSTGLSQVMGAIATNKTSPDFPDIQIYFTGYEASCAPGEIGALRSPGRRIIRIRVVYLHPKSKGRISLASDDPLVYPVIWGNYLGESNDADRLIEGIEMALKLANMEALKAYEFTLATEPLDDCSHCIFLSTEYWACAIGLIANPENHPAGSCKMGPANDPLAVVDPQLRVHGIRALRVVDTGIMPEVTSGNTAAPTMMIGERAADFIKKDHGQTLGKRTLTYKDARKRHRIK